MKSKQASFFNRVFCSCVFFLACAIPPLSNAQSPEFVAHVDAEPISEMSGIVKSRARDDMYWVHNDSGDTARIFALDGKGLNVIPTYSKFSYYGEEAVAGKEQWQGFTVLFAENIDWEDMTIDENYLYVSDMGNNGNKRQDLGIYLISEIDPTASTQSATIKYLPVRYPEQQSFPAVNWHFDSESLFNVDGTLFVITKHRVAGKNSKWEAGANLYRLDTDFSDEENILTFVEGHAEITAATSAEVSPNGQTLAVLSLSAIWLFEKPETGDNWLSSVSKKIELDTKQVKQTEGITWIDDEVLLITNEQRDMFKVKI